MIDLHCHLLPGIDDGSPDLATSIGMARLAVADGITTTACTPHIYPGLYENSGPDIRQRVQAMREALSREQVGLNLVVGADAHLVPEMLSGLKSQRVPTLNGSRYFLLEPSHHVAPPRFKESVFETIIAGYVPVITHPERLTWIADHYAAFKELVRQGAWMQITSGALIGKFGKNARYWAERFASDGLIHIIASDGHTTGRRSPIMAEGRDALVRLVGERESGLCTLGRPQAILDNTDPASVPKPPGCDALNTAASPPTGLFGRWFRRS
jgi:protein-tyrosine phosphatase